MVPAVVSGQPILPRSVLLYCLQILDEVLHKVHPGNHRWKTSPRGCSQMDLDRLEQWAHLSGGLSVTLGGQRGLGGVQTLWLNGLDGSKALTSARCPSVPRSCLRWQGFRTSCTVKPFGFGRRLTAFIQKVSWLEGSPLDMRLIKHPAVRCFPFQ